MEALRVQRTGHGHNAGLLTRDDSPVRGASNSRDSAGARTDRSGIRCTPYTGATGLPDAAGPAVPSGFVEAAEAPVSGGFGAGATGLLEAIAVVKAAAIAAPGALAMAGYAEAAHYAGMAEELSRTVEYIQVLSAGAVD
ncbi:MAG TPA: hypothetical protein VJ617_16310, partial [Arthrobacter sp.]|nr:hypothetical protein [Arthrobacter sp.]